MATLLSVPRRLPLTVIDSPQPIGAEAHAHHDAAGEGPRTLGAPAPCLLFVGDTPISEAEIAQEMQFHRAPRPELSRAAAARALVVRELLRREGERLGLAVQLPADGGESAEEAMIRVLLEREVEQRVPDADACERYFAQNAARFRSQDRMKARHILLAAPADDIKGRDDARRRGERLIAELQQRPELFADFAMRHSDCPSREQGGELGWLQRGQTTPEFDRQLFRLRRGLAGFPVESRWGYHVVCVDLIEPGNAQPFEQVRQQIADYLELQARQRDLQHYLQKLQERYGVHGLDAIEAAAQA
ncbi:peptidylprolyl isomerase [Xanthomonas euvesicatoria]|uniref:peptidylprolyl isomerase n=1 Tax=Xanthomonas euvesicatoria TaxID=456327 RepID=UPI001C43BD9A|nr:peptidylprolyl isomerase [Xanthomonas campestris pv. fici]